MGKHIIGGGGGGGLEKQHTCVNQQDNSCHTEMMHSLIYFESKDVLHDSATAVSDSAVICI